MKSVAHKKSSVLRDLRALADPNVRAKMAYFGIQVEKAHGLSVPELRRLAKKSARITNSQINCGTVEFTKRNLLPV